MTYDPQCEAGCMSFTGGEKKHHRDCVHYPESLTKLWHDTEAPLLARIERLEAALKPFADRCPDAAEMDDDRPVSVPSLTIGMFRAARAKLAKEPTDERADLPAPPLSDPRVVALVEAAKVYLQYPESADAGNRLEQQIAALEAAKGAGE